VVGSARNLIIPMKMKIIKLKRNLEVLFDGKSYWIGKHNQEGFELYSLIPFKSVDEIKAYLKELGIKV